MPNNLIHELNRENREGKPEESESGPFGLKTPLVWENVIYFFLLHVALLYCIFTFNFFAEWRAVIWGVATYIISIFGVTAGVHRLWSHRSYKAKWPLRVLLLFCFYTAGQLSVYDWVRYHRVHHKYSDTDADPHNSNRGVFFSHMGWLMMKENAEVQQKVKQIDMRDILTDPIVAFADKHFLIYKILCAFVIPVLIPVYFWNDTWEVAIKSQAIIRFVATLHATYSINSFAHMWGPRPYIASINPVQRMYMSILTLGEGWHNYHHAFPWDYKAAEYGPFSTNVTRYVIDFFSKIGWAYDLKQPSVELIRQVVVNKGDGSHAMWKEGKPEESESGPFGLKTPLVWENVIYFFLLHVALLYCIFTFNFFAEWRAVIWGVATYIISIFGVTAGVHRLWSHRSYKAKWPLRVLLPFCFYTAGQRTVYDCARDHRVHHKYPHNSTRGLFFSHMGWLMMKKFPLILQKSEKIGWAYDLKQPSIDVIKNMTLKKGDGSHAMWKEVPPPIELKGEKSMSFEMEIGHSAFSP
ncbi:hypothetical protein KM043_002829 [Ampulex compressa]|nr:hypothetical protein KM043_002829 [Ampulex compressa]